MTIAVPACPQGLTVNEAARALDISEAALRQAIYRGRCPATRHLGRVRLTQDDLDAFVRTRTR
jgi:excisionase family DNA binding protein